jgi:DNA-binding NtrC family response regulator
MCHSVELAVNVARADVPVLITGPNGSGKEQIAKIIQANSQRSDQPFVCVNMGAIPEELMEAELFGAEVGAYTGLTKRRVGRFEAAHGGTLFLDEIGNLSLEGQAKLLRVLQTGQFEPLGSHQTKTVDVRIVSATNANLKAEISAKRFREDLYYRINVIEIELQGLANRRDDIEPLAKLFLSVDKLPNSVSRALNSYHWPGNVRELQNCCQRASILSAGRELSVEDFGLPAGDIQLTEDISEADIRKALTQANGTVAKAARSLGLSRQSLYRRMDKFGIKD